jgi:hypothetical protein
LEEVQRFSVAITHFLLQQGAKLIVVGAMQLRQRPCTICQVFPGVPFVGMEPAVKPLPR